MVSYRYILRSFIVHKIRPIWQWLAFILKYFKYFRFKLCNPVYKFNLSEFCCERKQSYLIPMSQAPKRNDNANLNIVWKWSLKALDWGVWETLLFLTLIPCHLSWAQRLCKSLNQQKVLLPSHTFIKHFYYAVLTKQEPFPFPYFSVNLHLLSYIRNREWIFVLYLYKKFISLGVNCKCTIFLILQRYRQQYIGHFVRTHFTPRKIKLA